MTNRKAKPPVSEVNTLVFPLTHFQTILRMLASEPERIVLCPVGISRLESETRYLVRRVESSHALLSDRERESSICVSMATDAEKPDHLQFPSLPISPTLGHLIIGGKELQGRWWGVITTPSGAPEALNRILLVGAGMHELKLPNPSGEMEQGGEDSTIPMREAYQRFSRTIGALGARNWGRLTSLPIAIIGCGRTGSIAAVTLARLGVRSLILMDADVLEAHNIAEMDGVSDHDVGRPKVEALADFLKDYCTPMGIPLNITTIPKTITISHHAALAADVLFCCVDNDAARLACGILATLFHKVLIDIGTGVFNESNSNRMMGADVRLILPTDGCLRCFGSVANYDEGIKNLIACNLSYENSRQQEQWWLRRSGSLRTLNMMAVSIGVQLLCDLIAGRVKNSSWVRLEYDESGRLTTQHVVRSGDQSTQRCPLCIKAGLGDDGLLWGKQTVNTTDNKNERA